MFYPEATHGLAKCLAQYIWYDGRSNREKSRLCVGNLADTFTACYLSGKVGGKQVSFWTTNTIIVL